MTGGRAGTIGILSGERVVVTGGAGGVGRAVAARLVADGADVLITDLDAAGCASAAAEVGCRWGAVDVTDAAAVDAYFAGPVTAMGGATVLVTAAGVVGTAALRRRTERIDAWEAHGRTGPLHLDATVRLTDREWRSVLAVHLDGTFHCVRAALRTMVPAGRGAVVTVSSVCGLGGCAGSPHYSAAKGAVIAFTRAVAKDVAARGVRVNCVAPGYLEGPMSDLMSDGMRRQVLAATPVGRLGTGAEVADAVAYLAGPTASFVTGQVLSPNGGLHV